MAAEIPTTGPTTFEKIGILNNLSNQLKHPNSRLPELAQGV